MDSAHHELAYLRRYVVVQLCSYGLTPVSSPNSGRDRLRLHENQEHTCHSEKRSHSDIAPSEGPCHIRPLDIYASVCLRLLYPYFLHTRFFLFNTPLNISDPHCFVQNTPETGFNVLRKTVQLLSPYRLVSPLLVVW